MQGDEEDLECQVCGLPESEHPALAFDNEDELNLRCEGVFRLD